MVAIKPAVDGQGARPSTEYTPRAGMTNRLLSDPDALTLILQRLRVENDLAPGLDALHNVGEVNKYARDRLVVHYTELAHALLRVDIGMSPLGLATMIRQMSPTHRDHLVHLAEQWNTPHAIEDYYFYECAALALPRLSSFVTAIGEDAFVRTSLNVVEWDAPELTTLSAGGFADCANLTLHTWHAPRLELVAHELFIDCTALVLSMWDSPELISINTYAFRDCAKLTLEKWNAPKLKYIGFAAFNGCTSLVLPDGLQGDLNNMEIENMAFRGCTKLSAKAKDQIHAINASALDPV